MALDTYANLKTAIANELNRSDLTSYIPDWITLCEARLKREEGVRYVRKDTITLSSATVALPSDFHEPVALYYESGNRYGPLERRNPQDMAELWGMLGGGTGTPRYCAYTKNGESLLVAPSPDTSYVATIIYVADLPVLSDSNTSNWVLEHFPDLYFYGSLMHSAPFLKDDTRLLVWEQFLEKGLEQLRRHKERQEYSGPLTMRPTRAIG